MPRMDCSLQRPSWWIIMVLISLSTLTDSQSVASRGGSSSSTVSPQPLPSRTRGPFQPQIQNAELRLRPRPVVVHCYPDSMRVVVRADMFDLGIQVDSRHLRLGSALVSEGSECGAVPSGEEEFSILTHLMDCGTTLSSTEEKIVYSNVLVYSPQPSSDGLLRLDEATIPVECHYEKRYAVDAIPLHPTWVPSVSMFSAEDQIDFNLLLMTADWQLERGSYSFFLGDSILFEVSAIMGNHMPLRVYVDHCVATATSDAQATLRYDFIEHNGCLVDAYLTNSSSHFLPRAEEHKLKFQLEAFRFHQEPNNQVYITCSVKAVPAVSTVSSENRACSIIENRWRSVDGNDQVCGSCDFSHRHKEVLPSEPPKTAISEDVWHPEASQGSLVQNTHKQNPASYFRVRPGMYGNQHIKPQQSSAGLMKRGAEPKAERTVQMGPITVLSSSKTETSPSDSKTVLSKNRHI